MTQELYQKVMKFAGEKHHNQLVPGTKANYLLHLANVAMEVLVAHGVEGNFNIDLAVQIAVLHDTIEDTDTDFTEIKNLFGIEVAQGVQALTKDESILPKENRMGDCLQRINQLPKEVGLVKIADRITNLQSPPKHWSAEKIEAYHEEAQLISKTLQNKNEYLNTRLDHKIKVYNKFIVTNI